MGNRYLPKLLIVGAHAVLYHRKPYEDALRSWAKKLLQTKPFKLVAIALAASDPASGSRLDGQPSL
jgi:transposase